MSSIVENIFHQKKILFFLGGYILGLSPSPTPNILSEFITSILT